MYVLMSEQFLDCHFCLCFQCNERKIKTAPMGFEPDFFFLLFLISIVVLISAKYCKASKWGTQIAAIRSTRADIWCLFNVYNRGEWEFLGGGHKVSVVSLFSSTQSNSFVFFHKVLSSSSKRRKTYRHLWIGPLTYWLFIRFSSANTQQIFKCRIYYIYRASPKKTY